MDGRGLEPPPPEPSPPPEVHAVSSIPLFPPRHAADPTVLALLGPRPGSAISCAAVVTPGAPGQGGEGREVKRRAWKVLVTKLGPWGCPTPQTVPRWLPLPSNYWCYLGSCAAAFRWPAPSSSSRIFRLAQPCRGERGEKRSLLPARSSSWRSSLALAWGRGHEMSSPPRPFCGGSGSWAVRPSRSRGGEALTGPPSCLLPELPLDLSAPPCSLRGKGGRRGGRLALPASFPLSFLCPERPGRGLPLSFRDLKGPVQLSTKGADKK